MLNKNTEHLKKIRSSNKAASDINQESKDLVLALNAHENNEEREILRKIGLDSHLRAAQEKADAINRVTVIEDKYKRNVFTGKDLRDYCYKYNLRIGLASRYKGPIGLEVAQAIIKLTNEHTVSRERLSGYVETTDINITESAFFILTDDFDKGTTVTLLYNPNRSSSSYRAEELYDNSTLVEIASFGKPFTELRMLNQLFYPDSGFYFFSALATVILFIFGMCVDFAVVLPYLIGIGGLSWLIASFIATDSSFNSYWNFKKQRD